MFENRETHPSYGLIQISRISGGIGPLFGSSIDHHGSIRLRVSRASICRDLHRTWYSDSGGQVIEVEMSAHQFAEAITTLNCGFGVPCTIRHLLGEHPEDPPAVHDRKQFLGEFSAVMKELADQLRKHREAVVAILEKKSLTKADREAILEGFRKVERDVGANIPFIHEQFNEAINKTVAEAKAEVDAFVTHAVVSAGLAALAVPAVSIPALNPPPEPAS